MLVMRENWEETAGEDKQTEANTLLPSHTITQESVSEMDFSRNTYFYVFM